MKDTKTIEITSSFFTNSSSLISVLLSFLKSYSFNNVYSDVRSIYSRPSVIRLLIYSKFIECKSVRHLLSSQFCDVIIGAKDVFYSIKNNHKINWRSVLWNQAKDCIAKVDHINMEAKQSDQIPCLIVDDTDIVKTGYFIEMIGKIFSHVGFINKLGFKSLNLTYWTGKTVFHLDYSLHIEQRKDGNQGMNKKQLTQRFSKLRPSWFPGSKRIKEATQKKTDVLLKMLSQAIKNGIKCKYLLVDSWFFNSELISFIIKSPFNIITRPKKNNWKYVNNNKEYTIGELINKYKNSKTRKWSRKLRMHYVEIPVEFKGNKMKIFLYKEKKRGTKWQILITTHLSLIAVKAYEIYKNRWSIEVSYKELKQHFRYGKCQSRNFIGQISDNTICLMAYNYMSLYKSVNEYQTIGGLFESIKQTNISPTVMEEFWGHLSTLAKNISAMFEIELAYVLEKLIYSNQIMNYFNQDSFCFTTET